MEGIREISPGTIGEECQKREKNARFLKNSGCFRIPNLHLHISIIHCSESINFEIPWEQDTRKFRSDIFIQIFWRKEENKNPLQIFVFVFQFWNFPGGM